MHSTPSLIIVCALAASLAGCGRQPEAGSASALPPARVRLAVVRSERLPALAEVTGVVRPVRRAQLAAKVMGSIEEMPVALGQRVRSGDLLARIGAAEISARLAQAQSQLNAARRDFERERDLLAKGASTPEMVRGLGDRLTAAGAMVREAEAMLGYTLIRAPFDGVIAGKFAEAGDLASPGVPLVEIEGTDGFQVEAGVPDSLVMALSPGAALAVEIPSRGVAFSGILQELSSAADSGAHTVLARIAVPEGAAVRSGEFARVWIAGEPVATLMAPAAAVSAWGQMERVFVAGDDNRAVLRLVRTGVVRGDRVEILSGLDSGERVVLAPPAGLREGQLLEVQP